MAGAGVIWRECWRSGSGCMSVGVGEDWWMVLGSAAFARLGLYSYIRDYLVKL